MRGTCHTTRWLLSLLEVLSLDSGSPKNKIKPSIRNKEIQIVYHNVFSNHEPSTSKYVPFYNNATNLKIPRLAEKFMKHMYTSSSKKTGKK